MGSINMGPPKPPPWDISKGSCGNCGNWENCYTENRCWFEEREAERVNKAKEVYEAMITGDNAKAAELEPDPLARLNAMATAVQHGAVQSKVATHAANKTVLQPPEPGPPSWEVYLSIEANSLLDAAKSRVLHKGQPLEGIKEVRLSAPADGVVTLHLDIHLPADAFVSIKGAASDWRARNQK